MLELKFNIVSKRGHSGLPVKARYGFFLKYKYVGVIESSRKVISLVAYKIIKTDTP